MTKKSENKIKKPAKVERLVKWLFGNFCNNCGVIDEEPDYGKTHWENIQTIAKNLKEKGTLEMKHKEFSDLIKKGTTFCKPTKRIFEDCECCKKLGVPGRC